jgi:CRP-like cAMP-binding protein
LALSAQAQQAAICAEVRRSETQLRLDRHDALMTDCERHHGGGHLGPGADPQRHATGDTARLARHQAAGWVRLLDHLPELAADLTNEQAAIACRALTVPAIELNDGRCALRVCEADPRVTGTLFGLIVIDGLLVREVNLGHRTATSLYGPGDAFDLRADEQCPLKVTAIIRCPHAATVAIFDDQVLAAMRRWPRMMARFFALMMRQLDRAGTNTAIAQLERVEDRLLGLFWQIADRWGRRSLDGILVDQPLTHEAIGHLIGARRPTVSLGLRALADEHLLQRRPDGIWVLEPGSVHRLTGAMQSAAAQSHPVLRRVAA